MTKLSIIIPIYNSQKYLEECLLSICNQRLKSIELILINDCSKDQSLNVCKKYLKKFNYIKLINHTKNKGVSVSRNKGINCAKGDYIFFVDSDDKLIRGSLKKILSTLNRNPQTELFTINSKLIGSNKIDKNQIYNISKKKSPLGNIKDFTKFRATCWNFIIKRIFLIKNKIFFKNIKVFEDQVFVSRLLCTIKNLKIIKKPIYERRIFETNTLGKKTGFIIVKSCLKIINEINKISQKKEINKIKLKKAFLNSRIEFVVEQLLNNILICSDLQIKKTSKFFLGNSKFIHQLGIKNKFINYLKKLINYKDEKIKQLKKKITINNNRVFIFCAGAYSEIILKVCYKLGITIDFIMDNNPNYLGQKMFNTIIKNSHPRFFDYKVLVCNKNLVDFKNIRNQLIKTGIKKNNIIHINI